MKKLVVLQVLVLCAFAVVNGQTPIVEGKITVSDGGGGIQELFVGLAPEATDTLDAVLGEAELPPPPPFGIFDARFVGLDIGLALGQGAVRDYRRGDSATIGSTVHELMYQVGTGSLISIDADLPPTMSIRVQDIITGTIVDTTLHGQEAYAIANPGAISRLKLTATYLLGPLAAPDLIAPANGDEGVGPIPTFVWGSVAAASAYHLVLAYDSLFSRVFADTTTADTTRTLHLLESGDYWWRVSAVGASGEGPFTDPWKFSTVPWMGVEGEALPAEFSLSQNYPNPFNPSTTIRYGLPSRSRVTLTVFNMLGQQVAILRNMDQQAGYHEVQFDASGLASGVYLYRLQAGDFVQSKTIVLVR